jgi:hypothetical protein
MHSRFRLFTGRDDPAGRDEQLERLPVDRSREALGLPCSLEAAVRVDEDAVRAAVWHRGAPSIGKLQSHEAIAHLLKLLIGQR